MKKKTLRVLNYLVERISEASTIRAIIVILSGVGGFVIDPSMLDYYVIVGVLIAQTVALILPDKITKNKKVENDNQDSGD